MATWNAWSHTRALAFLHARARELMLRRGVEELFVDVGGSPVHVYADGPKDAARTVVLLHGLGNSSHDWFRVMPLLAWRGDRVLAIDLPGHGYSVAPDERGYVHIRENAEVVKRVVDELGTGGDVALVGHSLGGWVATRAHLSGLSASRLVLVESAGLSYEGMWDSIELLRIEHEEDVKRFVRLVTHKVPFGFNLISREAATMFRSPAVINFLDGHDRNDVLEDEDLALVRAQTSILWGEDDGLIPPIVAHRWNAGILGSKLTWIPRCGHAPMIERPILFQNLLEEALGHPTFGDEVRSRIVARMPETLRKRFAKA